MSDLFTADAVPFNLVAETADERRRREARELLAEQQATAAAREKAAAERDQNQIKFL